MSLRPLMLTHDFMQYINSCNTICVFQTIANINETESWFFETVSKIDKPVVSLTNKKTNLPASGMKGEISTDPTAIKKE